MAKQRKRDRPRLDDTMAQGVGNEPQPSNTLPEAVVGQTEQPRGLDQPDEGDLGTIPEPSGGHSGTARNGRGSDRMVRESIVDRDRDSPDSDKV